MRSTLLGVAGAALLMAGAPPSDEFPIVRTQTPSTQQAVAATVGPAPIVTAVAAPRGSDALAVRWVSISASDLGTMLAAIATPAGRPPFPSVLLLHGDPRLCARVRGARHPLSDPESTRATCAMVRH